MAEKKTKPAAPKATAPRKPQKPPKKAAPKASPDASSLKVKVRNLKAETVGEATLPEEIFGVPFRRHLVWEVVKEIRAREHRGTHKTKVRSEVSGSGKKPFKQKHTGRARQGGGRPPIHRHGGTVFGPVPHSYDAEGEREGEEGGAPLRPLREGARNQVVLVDALKLATHKTRDFAGVLAKLGVEGKTLVLDRKGQREPQPCRREQPEGHDARPARAQRLRRAERRHDRPHRGRAPRRFGGAGMTTGARISPSSCDPS
jgi:large subunit ribosomal protein L4